MSAHLLRFLADESCDHAVIRALRADGHDVVAVSERSPRALDRALIESAWTENRVLLTEDKDFGWLVHVSHARSPGVILIRFPGNSRRALVETLRALVRDHGARLGGAFVVLQPGQIRIEPGPTPGI